MMFSAEPLIRRIGETEHGAARLDAIADAIREADAASAHSWRFYFRFEAIRESIFYDDAFKAILSFPELLQIFDEHPELEDEYADDMLCAFKWVLENATKFYQVSREQIDRNFDEYERRCRKYGVSMRVYHMKKCNYLLKVDKDAARREYDAFHKCARDGYSDCEACEIHFDMTVALEFGELGQALQIAKPILSGDQRCGEIPHYTYESLASYYLYHGDIPEASYFGELCERLTQGDPEFLDATGTLLMLYSVIDPSHGWKLFKQCLPQYIAAKNPEMRLQFADGASRLMGVLAAISAEQGEDGMSHAPVLRCLPLEMTEEGMPLSAIRDYFRQEAVTAADRLDQRNGSTYFRDRLDRTIDTEAAASGNADAPKRPAHGITRRIPCVLMACLPEEVHVDYETMAQRVREQIPEETELISCAVDEEGLFVSYRRDKRVYDYALAIVKTPTAPPGMPVADLSDEVFEEMCRNPERYLLRCQLGEPAQRDYHYVMQLLQTILPEMLGVIDIMNRHAYSADWVRFKGTYSAAMTPNDLFGLYLTGDQRKNEVWMTTLGLNVIGMRDLEIIGATTENFAMFADMLDRVAAQAVENGMLPDADQTFGTVYLGEEPYNFCWREIPEFSDPTSVAAQIERDLPCAELLLDTDDGAQPLTACALLAEREIDFPGGGRNFRRRIALAKQTFHYLRDALQTPFAKAAVRLEFHLDEEMRKKYNYGIELLWAEIVSVDGGTVRAVLQETEETLPQLHEGDLIEVDPDAVAGWFFLRSEDTDPVTEQDAYLLEKEAENA